MEQNNKKIMKLWDIVLMNVAAILGLRWLPIAASYGAASTLLWILAAALFFIPLGLVVASLSSMVKSRRGMYDWVREAYGEKCAFFISWFYLIGNLFFFPAALTFISIIVAYMIEPALAKHAGFVCAISLSFWWFVFWASCRSLKWIKRIVNLSGALGTIIPGLMIVALAAAAVFVFKHPVPTDFSWRNWLPKFGSASNIAFLSILMFAMSGAELTPMLSAETENAQRIFSKAIFISALFIVGIYVVSTLAMTFVLPPHLITASEGVMDVMAKITTVVHAPFILLIFGAMLVIGQIGALESWFVVPAKMFLENVSSGSLPKFLTRVNDNDMPTRILFIEAIVISLLIIGSLFSPTLNVFYETIALMTSVTYFIPFIFIFSAFVILKTRRLKQNANQKKEAGVYIASVIGIASVLSAIILPFIVPPGDVIHSKAVLMYRIELFSGPFIFGLLGGGLYWHAKKSIAE